MEEGKIIITILTRRGFCDTIWRTDLIVEFLNCNKNPSYAEDTFNRCYDSFEYQRKSIAREARIKMT